MTPAGTNLLLAHADAAPAPSYVVTKSLRLNNPDTPRLSFTPSSTGDQKKWTTAFWFKRSKLSYNFGYLFGASSHSGNNGIATVYYDSTDKLQTYYDTTGTNPAGAVNDRVYRDPAGWMQIIWAVDAVNTTQRIWINGVEETLSSSLNPPNYAYGMNESGNEMKLGCRAWDAVAHSFDGYYAQFVHLDGQYITDPTEFGQVSSTTGEWEPIELTSSSFTYGTNGVLLQFLQTGTSADSSGIGADTSGNDNHWSVTNLAASDVVEDTPTDNYCVLNGIDHSGGTTLTEGNLEYDTSAWNEIRGTMGASSGKWYYEVYVDNYVTSSEAFSVGIAEVDGAITSDYWSSGSWSNSTSGRRYGVNLNVTTVSKIEGGSATSISATISSGDVISILLDLDSATTTLKFWVNGGSEQTLFSSLAAGTYAIGFNSYTASLILNTGQDPTFAGNDPVGSPATSAFAYTPTSGYKAWATANLPTPTIKKGVTYFDTKLYDDGDGAKTFDNGTVSMQPDLVWVKSRGSTFDHKLTDSVRGVTKALESNTTDTEATDSTGLTAFGSDGFTVGADTNYSDTTGDGMVAWAWKKSATAGFGVMTWTGDGILDGDEQDVAHGCGGTPQFVIAKDRDGNFGSGQDWIVWHHKLSADKFLVLNDSAGEASWDSSYPLIQAGAANITFGIDTLTSGYSLNDGPDGAGETDYVAYAWREVEGFSKAGSFSGSSTAFIYTGFRPAFILAKRSDATGGNWMMFDDQREGYNVDNDDLMANSSAVEATTDHIDILSNGFKIRTSDADLNGGTVIYLAVAKSPLKYAVAR
jgi:hypothetical protein